MVAKGIRDLVQVLRAAGKHITIETAATVPPDGIACDLAPLSPKQQLGSRPLPADAWQQEHEKLRLLRTPGQFGQRFQFNSDTESKPNRTPIPGQIGQ